MKVAVVEAQSASVFLVAKTKHSVRLVEGFRIAGFFCSFNELLCAVFKLG